MGNDSLGMESRYSVLARAAFVVELWGWGLF